VLYESLQEDGALEAVVTYTKIASKAYLKPARTRSNLVDLSIKFASLQRPTKKDISVFQEQFYTLILNTDSGDRQKISKTIAGDIYVPKPLIIFMAMEEIAIASLPLLHSPILQPNDLNLIIQKCSIEHAAVIAKRNNLDARNVKALLELDTEAGKIKQALKSNHGLTKSPEVLKILEEADSSNSWIEAPADKITTHKTEVPQISSNSKDLSDALVNLASKAGKIRHKPKGKKPKSLLNAITLKQIEKQLLSCIRLKDYKSFALSVQNFCGLNQQITSQFMQSQNAGKIATLLRALEITDVTAARILLLANDELGRNGQIFKLVMNKYKNLDQAECVAYFTKQGADFTHVHYKEAVHKPTTRYALALAARERRAQLLKRQEEQTNNLVEMKLSA